ncbi:hypothetical protein Nepgr_014175 [Nepenthes gracilis]|uniref:Uncharacterized protein n=1 Tax=Nepenthes gracilis TaxID=150966 RepID=A0AAD3SKE1_NEPGR|nr:hypothetical protein Nepgr_014175 [Nepenthes gracilis]
MMEPVNMDLRPVMESEHGFGGGEPRYQKMVLEFGDDSGIETAFGDDEVGAYVREAIGEASNPTPVR